MPLITLPDLSDKNERLLAWFSIPANVIIAALFTWFVPMVRSHSKDHPWMIFAAAIAFLFVMFIATTLSAANLIKHYAARSRSIVGLMRLYIELIVWFAVVYYLFALLDSSEMHISGVHQIWWTVNETTNEATRLFDCTVANALEAFGDCLHFSIITAATVGYGDMLPKSHWLRAAVDCQVLLSTGLIVIGFGTYFSGLQKDGSSGNCKTGDHA